MNNNVQKVIFTLRLALGWLFFYAGITKVIDPSWSAAGYINSAKTFSGLFHWFGSTQNIGWVNFLNEWGLTLIGIALIAGILVRSASYFGILIMALYYLPILQFPIVGEHSLLVDEHIIYILVFLLLIYADAGKFWGLDQKISKK